MTDSVNLLVPADERFRSLGPEVGGRYVVAAGGSEADAGVVVDALALAVGALIAQAEECTGVELNFRTPSGPDGVVEVTVLCEGKSSVVTHPLPATKA